MSNLKSFLIGIALTCLIMVVGFTAVQGRLPALLFTKGSSSDSQLIINVDKSVASQENALFQDSKNTEPLTQSKANTHFQTTSGNVYPLKAISSNSGLNAKNNDNMSNESSTNKKTSNDYSEVVSMRIIEHGPLDTIDKDTAVLAQVYVSNIEGTYAMYEPIDYDDFEAIRYNYGKKLDVIKLIVTDNGLWYAIKEKYSNLNRDDDSDGVIETLNYQGHEWVTLYVKDNDAKSIRDIRLNNKQLSTINYLVINENYDEAQYHKQLIPEGYLTFEVIDAKLYKDKKSEAVSFVNSSNTYDHKENDVLTIALKNEHEPLILKDISINENTDDMATYTYKGYIKDLNQHLVSGEYYEIGDYKMFDMSTGELTQSFIEYPHISPDKSYIIAIHPDVYEVAGELELFKIENNRIVPIIAIVLPYWLPTYNQQDIFWATDGYLYLPVNHAAEFWDEEGDYNDTFQYVRLKVDL